MSATTMLRQMVLGRSGGRCECEASCCCDHVGRCARRLVGDLWNVTTRDVDRPETLANVEAVCAICHARRASYEAVHGDRTRAG